MPNHRPPAPLQPLLVSIMRQGAYLIASIHTALDDGQLVRFQRDILDQVGRYRARGIIIDVAALDVLDSFASNTLQDLAATARLRGATTVIVGINPEIAYTMVRLGMRLETVTTALDLDEGLAVLDAKTGLGRIRPPPVGRRKTIPGR